MSSCEIAYAVGPVFVDRTALASMSCGPDSRVQLEHGQLVCEREDFAWIGVPELAVARVYRSRSRGSRIPFALGWDFDLRGFHPQPSIRAGAWVFSAPGSVEAELRLANGYVATLEVRVNRARVCVRRFEVHNGMLLCVRDERDQVLEEYLYDGAVLVGARRGGPWRYFEYDDRTRLARCVRSWSGSGRFDRKITYAARARVIDDAVEMPWVVEGIDATPEVVDPEARRRRLSPGRGEDCGSEYLVEVDAGRISTWRVAGDGNRMLRVVTDAVGGVAELSDGQGAGVRWNRDGCERTAFRYRDGQTIAQLRSIAGQHVAVRVGAVACTVEYDEDGLLRAWSGPGGPVAIDHDAEGRVALVRAAGGQARVERDRAGGVLRVTPEEPHSREVLLDAASVALEWERHGAAGIIRRMPSRTPQVRVEGARVGEATARHLAQVAKDIQALGFCD